MTVHSLDTFLLAPEQSGKAGSEHVKEWLKYKAGQGVPDPDSSEEARNFYRATWGELLTTLNMEVRPEPTKFSREPCKFVQGDWMCSVWTTMKSGLRIAYGRNKNGFLWWQKPYIKNTFDGSDTTKKTYKELLTNFDEFVEIFENKELQKFIRNAYTPANLIIVPDGFNVARTQKTNDYWDLTLLYYFFEFNPEQELTYTPPKSSKSYKVGRPFHDLIESSIKNGDALFLKEWLNDKEPHLLPSKKPETLEEWEDLVKTMTDRIIRRRDAMKAAGIVFP